MREQVEGRHPVLSALKSGRVDELFAAEGMEQKFMQQLRRMASEQGVSPKIVPRARIETMAKTRGHQGVVAIVSSFQYTEFSDLLARALESGVPPIILVAAGVEDPANLGAIIRTAECAAVTGIIIPERRAVGVTEAVSRVAAGALEHMPVCRVTNLSQALSRLKEEGMWVYGADPEADLHYWEPDLSVPLVLVVGGEHRGIPRLVRENCDGLVSIPRQGNTGSLNVSQAAAIIIYESVRQRHGSRAP